MSLFKRLAGVVGSFFQIGGSGGPALKNNSGSIDARNASDSAYVNVRGLDPVGTSDFVTLGYAQANFGGGIVNQVNNTTLTVSTTTLFPIASFKVLGTGRIVINGNGSVRGT